MSPSHGCDQHVQYFLINIEEIISVFFYAVEVFWAKNIHITDLELDNISKHGNIENYSYQ